MEIRATIYGGVVVSASKGTLHPILFEFTREALSQGPRARARLAIRGTWWSRRARTRSSGRRDARETGRLLSRYCSMYNNLGAAQRRTPSATPAPSAGNLIPRGRRGTGGGLAVPVLPAASFCGGSSRWRRSRGWLQAKGSAWRLHRVANHLNCGWSYARASSTPGGGGGGWMAEDGGGEGGRGWKRQRRRVIIRPLGVAG